MALQIGALAVLALTPTTVGALVYVALFGAGSGTMTIMRAALLAERYGPANYGSISGAQSAILTGARTLAPLAAGLLATVSGYPALLWALAGLLAAGLVAIFQTTD
jgi:MFS family permease